MEVFDVVEVEVEGVVGFDGVFLCGVLYVDGVDLEVVVVVFVLEECGGGVEVYWLVVEEVGDEFGGVVCFELGVGVGEEGEGNSVVFGEVVEGEGGNGFDDFFDDGFGVVVGFEVGVEFGFDFVEVVGFFGEVYSVLEFFGFVVGEICEVYGDGDYLFLEEDDIVGVVEDGFEFFGE